LFPISGTRSGRFIGFWASIFLVYGLLLTFRMLTALLAPFQVVLPAATMANTLFFPTAMFLDIGVTFALLMINDRRISMELGKTEERLRLTLEATNDGIWDWNIPTGKGVFSPRYYRMLGFEPFEFPECYDSWKSLVHPDDVDRAETEINEHIHKDIGFSIEIRMRTKSGNWRWILTRGMVVERDRESQPVRMVGTHSDITDRKRAEEALRESEEKFRSLFTSMISGFALLEMIYDEEEEPIDCRYIDVNPAHEKLTGLKKEAIIGRTARQSIPGLEDYWIKNYGRVDKTGTPEYLENHVVGLNRWYGVFVYRTAPGFVAVTFEDVSERKRAEQELRILKERYELAVLSAGIGVWDWDIKQNCLVWDDQMYKLYGIRKEDFAGAYEAGSRGFIRMT